MSVQSSFVVRCPYCNQPAISARQVARSMRAFSRSLWPREQIRVSQVAGSVRVVFPSSRHAESFSSWLSECVHSRGPILQAVAWGEFSAAGYSVVISSWSCCG